MSPIAQRVLTYLQDSIAERGGTGRRPSKIEWEMSGPPVTIEQIVEAGNELTTLGLTRWEESEIMGPYLILCKAEEN
jgi:hypothetical protein